MLSSRALFTRNTTRSLLMDRESGEREEPPTSAPCSSHTAFDWDTTSNIIDNLYIEPDDLLGLDFPQQPTTTESLQSFDFPAAQLQPQFPQIGSSAATWFYQQPTEPEEQGAMSRNASSQGSKGSKQYQLMSSEAPADQAKSLSQNNKDQLISSLRTHKVNTITELRRIEKIFAYLDSQEVTEPMTSAWAHYVNSNNLLNELRGLTKRMPFSSECLDEAKALVVADPASVRSWNYCWLVLVKIEKENLILKYARALASKRSTWGDRQPTPDDARKFITACVAEWTSALRQLLKHWDNAPSTTGN